MDKATFRIKRFDPEKDSLPYFQEYELELEPGATLLNSLNKIKAELDASLTYRMSCGSAICGSCSMRANGNATLACKTQVTDLLVDGVVEISPLGNFKVLRDLAVDIDPFWDSLKKVDPWLKPDSQDNPEKEREQTPAQFLNIDDVTTCILCASCWSDCNVLEVDKKFLGPATLAKAHRFIYDSRDAKTEDRLNDISEKYGVWDCTHCGECSTRCPTETKPLARIEETRQAAMMVGVHNNNGARHVLGFRETVGKSGRLNENYLPPRSVGFLNIPGLLDILPVGLRMIMRGKAPPLIHHSIDKVDEVRSIFGKFDKYMGYNSEHKEKSSDNVTD